MGPLNCILAKISRIKCTLGGRFKLIGILVCYRVYFCDLEYMFYFIVVDIRTCCNAFGQNRVGQNIRSMIFFDVNKVLTGRFFRYFIEQQCDICSAGRRP